jgi:hypothetical protein
MIASSRSVKLFSATTEPAPRSLRMPSTVLTAVAPSVTRLTSATTMIPDGKTASTAL